jgi:hypothetical protein
MQPLRLGGGTKQRWLASWLASWLAFVMIDVCMWLCCHPVWHSHIIMATQA